MRYPILVATTVLAIATGALAQVVKPPPPAAQYVMLAGQSDQFEIQAGKLAAAKASSPDVRSFGAMMIDHHTKSSAMITAAAKQSKMKDAPPPPVNPDQQAMLKELEMLNGEAFDKDYITQQVTAHQQALALQSGYASSGDDPNLRRVASQIVPTVQTHLTLLQKMQQTPG